MMTETKARALDLSEPRLAPLRREDLPSFLVDLSTSAVLAASPACARLGIRPDRPLPPQIAEAASTLGAGRARPAALVRLRLPRSLTPRLFRGVLLDIDGAPAVLFADPAALQDDPALAVETRPPAPGPYLGLEPLEPAVRFTFEADADDRLRALSGALTSALGSDAEAWIGASFPELEATGHIVSGHAATDALARGAAFSSVHITVPGPVVLELELGGVPLFDAARRRVATRGFGVLRRWRPGRETTPSAFDVAPDAEVRLPLAGAPPAPPPPAARPAPGTAASSNVVPFSGLTPRESNYFDEIGRTLEAAMRANTVPMSPQDPGPNEPAPNGPFPSEPGPSEPGPSTSDRATPAWAAGEILDALPLATLLEDEDRLVHANRAFFQWTGWPDLDAVRDAGGVPHVLQTDLDGESRLLTAAGATLPVDAREVEAPFYAPDTRLHVLRRLDTARAPATPEPMLDPRRAALDLVPWPVLLIGDGHRIRFANRAAADRLGFDGTELEGQPVTIVIAPEGRAEVVGWLDRASASAERRRPRVLLLRPHGGEDFRALAGLSPVGDDTGQMCLVLGPEPRADSRPDTAPAVAPEENQSPATGAGTAAAPGPAARDQAAEPPARAGAALAGLHRIARRLSESLGPSFSTIAAYAPGDTADLPPAVRDALETVQKCVDDLGALAAPLATADPVPAPIAPLVDAAIAFVLPKARRRHVTLRTDIDEVPPITTQPARLARLIRLILEEAVDAAPADTAIIVSLLCDDAEGAAPVVLQVNDAGAPVDEVDDAAARDPLAPSPGTDRFSRAGRPLCLTRLLSEAHALGASFDLRRGIARGMTAQLTLPR